uniref:Cytochrome b n=1 Tax=Dermanyssus gallinae TaxID=34641 RepID=A0A7U3SL76_9ACAR|nr:cytochrome b [Dermanyssus gallinae]QPG86049.1 cytochrome b [Dermanyssus gallinae]
MSFLFNMFKNNLLNLPTPNSINYYWNFGSMLGICLLMQIITGIFLTFHYCSDSSLSFSYIAHIMRDVNYGSLLRIFHMNGASLFFIFIYCHIARGLYYMSYRSYKTWISGNLILILLMMTAFLGYILPWGQMSYWGATVITNLISAIPYIGSNITFWLWGGFSVNNFTLIRFFSLHFLTPMILMMMVMIHLMFLHETKSNNPLGLQNIDFLPFHPFFTWKDLMFFMFTLMWFFIMNMSNPYFFSDPENFNPANSMITPLHIQPEWYFLFAYSILRAVPNKFGGVIMLFMSILILSIYPIMIKNKFNNQNYYLFNKLMLFNFFFSFMMLTYLGSMPMEYPWINMNQSYMWLYFSYFLMTPLFFIKK